MLLHLHAQLSRVISHCFSVDIESEKHCRNNPLRSIRTDKRHLKIGVWRLADFLGAQNALLSGDAIAAKHRVRDSPSCPSALMLNFRATDLDDISCPPIYTILGPLTKKANVAL